MIFGILLVVVLIIAATFIFILFGGGRGVIEKFINTQKYNTPFGMASCEDKKEFFSVSPVAYEDFTNLEPLGALSPPAHTFPTGHMYFFIENENINDPESVPNKVPVVAPGDVTITKIASQEKSTNGKLENTDYNMDFFPCKELSGYLGHMSTLVDKLKKVFDGERKNCNEYSTGGSDYKNCEAGVEIKVKAGEVIGTAGGMKGQAALDLGMLDFRIEPLYYANQKRWQGKSVTTVCPVDYFFSSAKEEIYVKVGGYNEKRTIKPICGQIDQDIAGTAQGVWFKKGTPAVPESTYPEDPHLSLVHDNVDFVQPVFSVGNSVQKSGLEAGRYYYIPRSSGLVNRDFGKVVPGNTYCFDGIKNRFNPDPLGFIIVLELPTKETLKIERQNKSSCGAGPWNFTSNFSEFER